MKASYAALGVLMGIAVVYLVAVALPGDRPAAPAPAFHATLADAALYGDSGVYSDLVPARAGEYELRFVPNGDSPRRLGVVIQGNMTSFAQTFELRSERQGSESATYYTWEYLGPKDVAVGADTDLLVRIDPNGETMGPVSVSLVPK